MNALQSMTLNSSEHALFADSCIEHVQCLFDRKWSGVMIGQTGLQQFFRNWYYGAIDKDSSFLIDTNRPINPTCNSFYRQYLSDPTILEE